MLERDRERLSESQKRVDVLVLGSGALAGSGFALDRKRMARLLKLKHISSNSMDAVSDRDFILEFLSNISILSVHLSRFAEDLIIWSSEEFSFVEIHESFCTGSSIMPQKKNPDSLELIRGKCGRFIGNLTTLLVLLKGLPMAYNKDLQEDKEPMLDSVVNIRLVLSVFTEVIRTLKVKGRSISHRMNQFIYATDLADYLAGKKVPFRKSHAIVGKLVKHLSEKNLSLSDLSLKQIRKFSPEFDRDVFSLLNPGLSIKRRNIHGGTGPGAVRAQIKLAKKLLKK
jgi:argininosuccinate lyase